MKKIKHLFELYKIKLKEKPIKTLFYTIASILTITFILLTFISRGNILHSVIYPKNNHAFSDYYESLMATVGKDPYGNRSIYPPMCYLIYLFILRIVPGGLLNGESIVYYRNMQYSVVGFTAYVVITILLFLYLLKKIKQGKTKEKTLFMLLICLSIPFVLEFERQNIVFLALISLMGFIALKDAKNKVLREISTILLALSVSIKIYPAIFGILFIKEKKYKELLRLIIYSLILLILPFLFFGGFKEIGVLINNFSYTESLSNQLAGQMGFLSTINHILPSSLEYLSLPIFIILVLVIIFVAFINKSKWQTYALLIGLMIGIPIISFTYTLIFLVIPLIFFLDKKKIKKIDYMYLILFILIFFALPTTLLEHYKDSHYFLTHWSTMNKFMACSILLMSTLICIETIYNFIKRRSIMKKIIKLFNRQEIRFLFVGGLNTIVGYGSYALFLLFGINYLIANTIATIIGIIHSYLWNKNFTFKTKGKSIKEILRFVSVYVCSYVLGLITLFVFVKGLNINPYIAGLLNLVITTLLSWFGHKYFSFRRK